MNEYTFYENTTGKILHNYSGDFPEIQESKYFIIGTSNPETQYVNNGLLINRPENPIEIDKTVVAADGTSKVTLSAVPIGAVVSLDSITDIATVSTVELTFDIPGTYTVKVELFPYLPFEAVINAT